MGAEPRADLLLHGEGSLIAGDLGVVLVRSLLEAGVGYVVTGWTERATLIDAAIDDLRRTVLERAGIRLRRLREARSVESVVQQAGIGVVPGGALPRGLVVWNGRSGMVPTLEAFCQTDVPAAVVGLCYDTGVLRSARALVVEPEPTPEGLRTSLDQAFALSTAIGRPVLVLLRDRMLAMRGSFRARAALSVEEAAELDASVPRGLELADAAVALGLVDVEGSQPAWASVVCPAWLAPAVRRALALVDASLDLVDEHVGLGSVCVGVSGVALPGVASEVLGTGPVLVLDSREGGLARAVGVAAPDAVVASRQFHAGSVTGQAVVGAICAWLVDSGLVHGEAAERVARMAPAPAPATRLPRRGETAIRELAPAVSAGLLMAQANIGVPARVDAHHPTWVTRSGVPLTVVNAAQFGVHGAASAAPGMGHNVFLVTGPLTSEVQEAATSMGAPIEAVDGSNPRAVADAVARGCAAPRLGPLVIVLAIAPRAVDPNAEPGFDEDLLRGDQVALQLLPPEAVQLYEGDVPLARGPEFALVDPVAAASGVRVSAGVSPAWYELRAQRRADRITRKLWQLRRRATRALTGVSA